VKATDGELFAELYPNLLRFAAVVRPVGIEPEDLVQEALARVLAIRPLAVLDEPATYLRTVMVRIASNLQRGRRRAGAANVRLGVSEAAVDRYPSDLVDLLRVDARARAILFLTIVDGESYRTAADVVGCTETAARTIASRALKELHRQLDSELDAKEAT
jgi:DNA-directed RNA polymerase specialized sigma24 family protein